MSGSFVAHNGKPIKAQGIGAIGKTGMAVRLKRLAYPERYAILST